MLRHAELRARFAKLHARVSGAARDDDGSGSPRSSRRGAAPRSSQAGLGREFAMHSAYSSSGSRSPRRGGPGLGRAWSRTRSMEDRRMGYGIKRLQDLARPSVRSKELLERSAGRASGSSASARSSCRSEPPCRGARALLAERIPSGRVELTRWPTLEGRPDGPLRRDRHRPAPAPRRAARAPRRRFGATSSTSRHRVMTTSGSSGQRGCSSTTARPGGASAPCTSATPRRSGAWPQLPRLRMAMIGGGAPTHMSRRAAATLRVGLHRVLAALGH